MNPTNEGRRDWPLSDEEMLDLFAGIGMVACSWASLEHAVNSVIWALSSTSVEDGACVTSQIPSFIGRMKALIALLRHNGCSETFLGKMNKFTSEGDELARKRNRVIPDPWFVQKQTGETGRFQVSADRKLVLSMQPHTAEELRTLAGDIVAMLDRFKLLRKEATEEMFASVKKQLPELDGISLTDILAREDRGNETA